MGSAVSATSTPLPRMPAGLHPVMWLREHLAERGPKPVPLAAITSLVTGVVGLRLAGDAVLDLWRQDDNPRGDRAEARRQLLASADRMTDWYGEFAASLTGRGDVPEPVPPGAAADERLVRTVASDLRGDDGEATATAVRVIWTGDHLDAARRLQGKIVEPARTAVGQRALMPSAAWPTRQARIRDIPPAER